MGTAHARVSQGIGLGAKAPDVELTNEEGGAVFLSSYWEEQPLLLVLLNHLKPEAVVDHLLTLRDARDEFDEAGGAIVVISSNSAPAIAAFKAKRNVGLAMLSDHSGEAHATYSVPLSAPAAFVIDTGGVIRYAHRAATVLDTPSTWDLVDAVCGLTGAVIQHPEPSLPTPLSLHNDSAGRPAFAPSVPLMAASQASYSCIKCANASYEIVKIATSGGWISRLFNFQYRSFVAVVCTTCNHAELYRTKGGTAANIADILVGA